MQPTPFIWLDGKLIPWEKATVHVLSHGLHYGSGVFEGIRFYKTDNGPAIFRLEQHTKRLFYSASTLEMKIPYSEEDLNQAVQEVVASSTLEEGYIRPLAFYGYGKMGLNPIGNPINVMIACWGWGKYLADRPLNIKISKYMRIHPKSLVANAKVSGHYINSILSSLEVRGEEYDEAILLDYEGNVAEGPGENLFLIKNGQIYTPPLGNILAGITRETIFQLATDMGIPISEKTISPDELFTADELFFTGTAAEVSPIGSVDGKKIGDGQDGKITSKIRSEYMALVTGKSEKHNHWCTYIQ